MPPLTAELYLDIKRFRGTLTPRGFIGFLEKHGMEIIPIKGSDDVKVINPEGGTASFSTGSRNRHGIGRGLMLDVFSSLNFRFSNEDVGEGNSEVLKEFVNSGRAIGIVILEEHAPRDNNYNISEEVVKDLYLRVLDLPAARLDWKELREIVGRVPRESVEELLKSLTEREIVEIKKGKDYRIFHISEGKIFEYALGIGVEAAILEETANRREEKQIRVNEMLRRETKKRTFGNEEGVRSYDMTQEELAARKSARVKLKKDKASERMAEAAKRYRERLRIEELERSEEERRLNELGRRSIRYATPETGRDYIEGLLESMRGSRLFKDVLICPSEREVAEATRALYHEKRGELGSTMEMILASEDEKRTFLRKLRKSDPLSAVIYSIPLSRGKYFRALQSSLIGMGIDSILVLDKTFFDRRQASQVKSDSDLKSLIAGEIRNAEDFRNGIAINGEFNGELNRINNEAFLMSLIQFRVVHEILNDLLIDSAERFGRERGDGNGNYLFFTANNYLYVSGTMRAFCKRDGLEGEVASAQLEQASSITISQIKQAKRGLGEGYGFGVDRGVGNSRGSPFVIRFAHMEVEYSIMVDRKGKKTVRRK